MSSEEIRKKFLAFFKSKGHAVVSSSSLIPDDPSVLLTTAGMQQFKKYFTGELEPQKDFGAKSTTSIQKSFRTSDIDEVGDESHLTFFEMLGNFSFGEYFKQEAIAYAHEFITSIMGLTIDYVSVFGGEGNVPADTESEAIWKSIDPNITVKTFGRADNFWGPTGSEGPCGPTTEIYIKNANGTSVEIWNVVFNQYYQDASGKLTDLKTPGIDTGMGLERLAMVSQNVSTIFETDLFSPFMNVVKTGNPLIKNDHPLKLQRIAADHTRALVFLITDGVRPSNKEAGYILRRLIRRLVAYGVNIQELITHVVDQYHAFYPELATNQQTIVDVVIEEEKRFTETLRTGIAMLEKMESVDAKSAFKLYESYGLPYDVVKEYDDGKRAASLTREAFDEEFKRHQEVSRAGQEKKFGGHGLILNTGELKAKDEEELKKVTRLHTATHLLQAALRKVLGNDVSQKGSDITVERTRFDFSFPRKLTPEEIAQVESLVNQAIQDDLPMQYQEMSKDEAVETGALYFFKEKYPDMVKVYFAGESLETAFSKEFCGGPHVTHTGEIGKFKIAKEESVAAGVRRIRGVVEP